MSKHLIIKTIEYIDNKKVPTIINSKEYKNIDMKRKISYKEFNICLDKIITFIKQSKDNVCIIDVNLDERNKEYGIWKRKKES